jgi:uncharacterized protein YjbI with pentapeptide repeats
MVGADVGGADLSDGIIRGSVLTGVDLATAADTTGLFVDPARAAQDG